MGFTRTVTSFHAADVSREQLGPILADYLALERLKVFRHLLIARCGLLAVLGALAARVSGFPPLTSFVIAAVVMSVPAAAFVSEVRAESRLARRIARPHEGRAFDGPPARKS